MKTLIIFEILTISNCISAQTSPCTSNLGGAIDPGFVEIRINNTSFNHQTFSSTNVFYNQYPANGTTTASLVAGNTYEIYTSTSSEAAIAIWVDSNNDAQYDAQEYNLLVNSGITQNTSLLTIPASTPSGELNIRLRSRAYGSLVLADDACRNFGSGETRDYKLQIINNALSVSESNETNNFKIYPNPVINELNLQSKDIIEFVSIYDASGKEITKKNIGRKNDIINVSSLSNGSYLVKVKTRKEIYTSKIIKK